MRLEVDDEVDAALDDMLGVMEAERAEVEDSWVDETEIDA